MPFSFLLEWHSVWVSRILPPMSDQLFPRSTFCPRSPVPVLLSFPPAPAHRSCRLPGHYRLLVSLSRHQGASSWLPRSVRFRGSTLCRSRTASSEWSGAKRGASQGGERARARGGVGGDEDGRRWECGGGKEGRLDATELVGQAGVLREGSGAHVRYVREVDLCAENR